MDIGRGDSSMGWDEERAGETLGCREKYRGVWSHADWVGIPSLKLSFLFYQRRGWYGASGLGICDSTPSPTSLAQGPVWVGVFSEGTEQSARRPRYVGPYV